MSTSQHTIRLAQVSYQIRGEIVSKPAEAGFVCLRGCSSYTLPYISLFFVTAVLAKTTVYQIFVALSVAIFAALGTILLPIKNIPII